MPEVSDRTSLQRLQALENDFETLDDQLSELETIVLGRKSEKQIVCNGKPSNRVGSQGRINWALRWLLKKLQSNTESELNTHSNPGIWRLLSRVIERLDPVAAARALRSYQILDCVEKTLTHVTKHQSDAIILGIHSRRSPRGASVDRSDLSIGHQTAAKHGLEDAPISSSKRLKASNGQHTQEMEMSIDNPYDSLDTIVQFLISVSALFINSSTMGLPHSPGLISPFRGTEPVQAARLLGGYLRSLNLLRGVGSLDTQKLDFEALKLFLQIWNFRDSADGSVNPSETAIMCSRECLVPAIAILVRGAADEAAGVANRDRSEAHSIINLIERFVAKEILMPLKSTYLQRTQQHASDPSQPIDLSKDDFQQLLEPISKHVLENKLDQRSCYESTPETIFHAIGLISSSLTTLFQIAVRCTPLNSTRSRANEQRWLEFVLLQTCSSCGLNPYKIPQRDISSLETQLLGKLLRISNLHRLKLSPDLLRHIAAYYCGASSEDPKEAELWILKETFDADHDVFVDRYETHKYDSNIGMQDITSLLFRRISQIGYSPKRRMHERAFGAPLEYNYNAEYFAFPLLKAFAGARMTPSFVKHWHRELIWFYENLGAHNYSIWENTALYRAVSDVVGTSITSRQAITIVDERLVDLQNYDGHPKSDISLRRGMASAVILSAVLYAGTQNQELRSILFVKAREIFSVAADMLEMVATQNVIETTNLLRLLALVHRLWTLQVDSTVEQTEFLVDEKYPLQLALPLSIATTTTLDNDNPFLQNSLAAVACLGSIITDFRNRHWDVRKYLSLSSITSIIDQHQRLMADIIDIQDALDLDSISSDFPALLNLQETGSGQALDALQKTSNLALLCTAAKTFPGLYDMGLVDPLRMQGSWYRLIQRSHTDAPWLFTPILKVLSNMSPGHTTNSLVIENYAASREFLDMSYLRIPRSKLRNTQRKQILDELVESVMANIGSIRGREWSRKFALVLHLIDPLSNSTGLNMPLNDVFRLSKPLDDYLATLNLFQGIDSTIEEAGIILEESQLGQYAMRSSPTSSSKPLSVELESNEAKVSPNIQAAQLLRLFKEIVRLCIRQNVQRSNGDPAETLLQILKEIFSNWKAGHHRDLQAQFSILSGLLETMTEYSDATTKVAEALQPHLVDICGSLCDSGKTTWSGYENLQVIPDTVVIDLKFIIELLSKMPSSSLRQHQFSVESIVTIVQRILTLKNKEDAQKNERMKADRDDLEVLAYRLGCKVDANKFNTPNLSQIYDILSRNISPNPRAMLDLSVIEFFSNLPEENRESFIRDLLQDCRTASSKLLEDVEDDQIYTSSIEALCRWEVLRVLVSASMTTTKSGQREPLIPLLCIPEMLIQLAITLIETRHSSLYLRIASIIAMVLQANNSSKAVTQPAIEAILSAITSMPNSQSLNTGNSRVQPKIYIQLTSIVRSLLQQHRRRLSGRFDLLIASLQVLLRPLFTMPWAKKVENDTISKRSNSSSWLLKTNHAERFTKLVTLFCDPPLSSTNLPRSQAKPSSQTNGRKSNRDNSLPLIDENRKARKQAGRYVPQLLLTFCEFNLKGKFVAEGVREALIPGVYAMFDVMGSDVLAAVYNAAEDDGGLSMPDGVKTVFKSWWDLWKKERGRRA